MSWIGELFSSSTAAPIAAVGNVLDGLFTSDDEKLDKNIIMQRLAQKPQLAQIELNKVEAQHRSMFVAGWRPFIGWVCGFALLYSFIIRDVLAWYLTQSGSNYAPPPELAMEHLMAVLMALLGLGGYRTFEKIKGKSK